MDILEILRPVGAVEDATSGASNVDVIMVKSFVTNLNLNKCLLTAYQPSTHVSIQFNFIYIAPAAIKIVSRHFKHTQGLIPTQAAMANKISLLPARNVEQNQAYMGWPSC